ncbi:hypothetical protein Anas_08955 [Armadillidium nasatum]|uniref:Uncharacterized protein n=1 Tax=Armadillidium nasatum TaxID=96803 RepID=A0A5N5SRF1_9CRUS|nr:hypothetical protein Anas_08955 [Armadillidium nasatum]
MRQCVSIRLMDIPMLAIEYCLSEVKPSTRTPGTENVWSEEAIELMKNTVLQKLCFGELDVCLDVMVENERADDIANHCGQGL